MGPARRRNFGQVHVYAKETLPNWKPCTGFRRPHMEGTKRKNEGGHGAESESRRKKNKPGKYKSGTKASSSAQMKGPGIFVTCARGREKKAAHELVEALEEASPENLL